jgi:pimeloyl-ACP methyl ester carboxylesterase
MTADALDLAVTPLGDGPPLVVLHGLLGRARNWLSVARALQGGRRLHLAELRNHGASPWSEVMDYPAMAADVAALIERQAGGRAAVMGHSMGGKVAIHLALTRPELVERLVVVDIAPVAYPHQAEFEGYLRAMQGMDLAAVGKRADADAALAAAVPEPAIRAFLLQNLDLAGDRPAWQPNLAVLLRTLPAITGFPAELDGRTFTGPAFGLRGERSNYVGPEGEAALRRFLPGVEVATVPGAGHWLHAERPAEFLELLKPSLAS